MDSKVEQLMVDVLKAGGMEIRDVEAGERPFLYSSGNWGPGYVSIKGLVSQRNLMAALCKGLGERVIQAATPNFVAANVSGGMIPGWLLAEYLFIPYVYVRETRKKGGQQEHITGITSSPRIPLGANGIVVEELVNFAQTTCNSAEVLRNSGYEVTHAACVLFYDNPEAIKALERENIRMVYLFTLPELLDCAERHGTYPVATVQRYREFLKDPLGWQTNHSLTPVVEGGTR